MKLDWYTSYSEFTLAIRMHAVIDCCDRVNSKVIPLTEIHMDVSVSAAQTKTNAKKDI